MKLVVAELHVTMLSFMVGFRWIRLHFCVTSNVYKRSPSLRPKLAFSFGSASMGVKDGERLSEFW